MLSYFNKAFLKKNSHRMKVIHYILLTRMVLIHLSMRICLASTEKSCEMVQNKGSLAR